MAAARRSPAPRLDVAEVRAALTADVARTLAGLGWDARKEGSQLVGKACPERADHSRACWKISPVTGQWRCMSCGTAGDLFNVVAAVHGLHLPRDFAAVLAAAAALVGVGPSVDDEASRARRAGYAAAAAAAAAQAIAVARARACAAIHKATAIWARCADRDARGEAYLASRGIAWRPGLCRFDLRQHGSPAVPLLTSRGQIRNVVRRLTPEALADLPEDDRDRKTPGLAACPTAGTLLFSVTQIVGGLPVLVTEGVADTLTAALAWPTGAILGAHGADNLPAIVRVAAPLCRARGAPMYIVPHDDAPGERVLRQAMELAEAAGIAPIVVRTGAKDLNDAWRNGWRPAV